MAESTQDAAQIVRAHNELWNDQDYAQIPDVVAESYVEYNPAAPDGEIHGPDGLEEWIRGVTAAFPDIQAELLDVFAEQETVIAEVRFTMTHEGEFAGIPPTKREVEFQALGKFRVDDGNITELRNYFDPQVLFDQLGVVESPGEQGDQHEDTKSAEQDNKAVMRRFFDAWNEADFETIEEVVAPDAKQYNPVEPAVPAGPEGEEQLVEAYHSAFTDATLTVEEMVAEDDRVAVRYTATGTHDGEFMGIEPTGNDAEIVGYEIDQLADGQVVESWGLFDAFGLMEQLGVVEQPGE